MRGLATLYVFPFPRYCLLALLFTSFFTGKYRQVLELLPVYEVNFGGLWRAHLRSDHSEKSFFASKIFLSPSFEPSHFPVSLTPPKIHRRSNFGTRPPTTHSPSPVGFPFPSLLSQGREATPAPPHLVNVAILPNSYRHCLLYTSPSPRDRG